MYLWWLAIITFDLTFVWHLYIRDFGAQKYLEERKKSYQDEQARKRAAEGAAGATSPPALEATISG